jgi:LacI family transcriptional regulator
MAPRAKKPQASKTGSSTLPKPRHIPHVLLLVDTAGAVGRGVIEGVGRYAAEHGPWSIQYEYRALDSLPPKWLKAWKGDGIITRTVTAKQAQMIRCMKQPCVEVHGHPKYGLSQFSPDPLVEAQLVAEHFLSQGFRHFAYFAYGERSRYELHREIFCRTLKEQGHECHIYLDSKSQGDIDDWDKRKLPKLIKWLRGLPRPIGVTAFSDLHAVCLLEICRQLDIAVPEELAILGRGNDAVICETVRPTISSIDLDARRVGYEAARILEQKMAGKKAKETIVIPPSQVVVRQSTDLMAIEDADVVQAIRFIRNYACAGITVPRVAEEVGLSRRALERRFIRHLGRSPKTEIMRIRIERAQMLLTQTDMFRENIAQICGFAFPAYFSRVFHSIVGMTPNAYRRSRRIYRESQANAGK